MTQGDRDCSIPAADGTLKCTFMGCHARGLAQTGFDFFVCDECDEKFQQALMLAHAKQHVGRN